MAKEQTKSARDTIDGLDGKDAEPILEELELAMTHLRLAEKAAIALTKKMISEGKLPDEREKPDRRTGGHE